MENIKEIPGHPGYYISKDGKVYMGDQLIPKYIRKSKPGYSFIRIGKKRKPLFIHKLVAVLFIGTPPPGKPLVLHKDDIKSNNNVENLYYGDWTDNQIDMNRNGKRKLNPEAVKYIRKMYPIVGSKILADKYGVLQGAIMDVVNGKRWKFVPLED